MKTMKKLKMQFIVKLALSLFLTSGLTAKAHSATPLRGDCIELKQFKSDCMEPLTPGNFAAGEILMSFFEGWEAQKYIARVCQVESIKVSSRVSFLVQVQKGFEENLICYAKMLEGVDYAEAN